MTMLLFERSSGRGKKASFFPKLPKPDLEPITPPFLSVPTFVPRGQSYLERETHRNLIPNLRIYAFVARTENTLPFFYLPQSVEALHYKPEGRGFDFRWCHRNFSLTILPALESTQPLTEMSTRNISWAVKAAGA